MTPYVFFLLVLTVVLSSLRTVLSKGVSQNAFGSRRFFLSQGLLFGAGSVALLFAPGVFASVPTAQTLLLALLYAIALIGAQWCYTASLKSGNTGLCATVYSLGFIIPTLSGCIAFGEELKGTGIIGVILVIPAIIISGIKPKGQSKDKKGNGYFIPLILAMISSGALGVLQKVQQKSPTPEQKGSFVLIAFVIAAAASFISLLFSKDGKEERLFEKKSTALGALVGVCFALCNILNTTLSGLLPSAVFFPTVNLGNIFLSLILGVIIYKDKIKKRDLAVFLLGTLSIVLLNL